MRFPAPSTPGRERSRSSAEVRRSDKIELSALCADSWQRRSCRTQLLRFGGRYRLADAANVFCSQLATVVATVAEIRLSFNVPYSSASPVVAGTSRWLIPGI